MLKPKVVETGDNKDELHFAKMRYYNATYMNDPEEGKYFFNCFSEESRNSIEDFYKNAAKQNELGVYLGSFLPKEDDLEDTLVLWRTYGKNENLLEAAGCSMVIAPEFYNKKSNQKKAEFDTLMYHSVYKVVYHKKDGFYNLDANKSNELKREISSLEKVILKLIGLGEKKNGQDKKAIYEIVFKELSKVVYLFKSANYAYENEIRVITYMPKYSRVIQLDESKPPKLYIESLNPMAPYLRSIYIGNQAEKASHWALYLEHLVNDLNKKRSEANLSPFSIDIKHSQCHYNSK